MGKSCWNPGKYLIVAFVMATCARLPAYGSPSCYYSVTLGGFSSAAFSDAASPAAEYTDFSASIEFAKGKSMNPAISMHYLLPVNPLSFADSQLGIGVDVTLFYAKRHPFSWMSPRTTTLAPLLSAAVYAPIKGTGSTNGIGNLTYILTFTPLRLFSGEGYFSAGALNVVFDSSFSLKGWGARLFEFSYFIF